MKHKIICGDCLKLMPIIPNNSVDLTVTSPPYDNLRDYKGYIFDFEPIAHELYRVTKEGGVVVWVVGDATIDGSETGTSFKQALHFKEIGFNLHDTMIYSKGAQGGAKGSNYAYTQSFEYMFVLSKGVPRTHNLINDRLNSTYKKDHIKKSAMRRADGNLHPFSTKSNEFGKRTNVWEIHGGYMVGSSDKLSFLHPATFPEALARDHIISWSNVGDTVLDPMCGSGTTSVIAERLVRNSISIEISTEYCNLAYARLAEIVAQTTFGDEQSIIKKVGF